MASKPLPTPPPALIRLQRAFPSCRGAWYRPRQRPSLLAASRLTTVAAASSAEVPSKALKEWAPTCAAIADGEQTILLRKGGIKEPMFKPEARDFLLFKTSFHTEAELLKPAAARRYAAEVQFDPRAQPQLVFETAATVTGAWTTADPDHVLQLLNELHVWGPGFLEKRLRWRQKQPVTILELRAYRLHTPIALPAQDDYWGCFSWLDLGGCQQLPGQLAAAGVPALSDAAFEAKQQLCRRQLALLSDVQELEF